MMSSLFKRHALYQTLQDIPTPNGSSPENSLHGVFTASGPFENMQPTAPGRACRNDGEKLLVALLMAVLPQPFLAFVRCYLMTLPFLSTRHNRVILMMNIIAMS